MALKNVYLTEKYRSDDESVSKGGNVYISNQINSLNNSLNNSLIGDTSINGTFLGVGAGKLFNEDVNYNTFIGANSGYSNSTGYSNTFLGHNCGQLNNGSRNLFIGYEAGALATVANDKLYIANSATNPLIEGDFYLGAGLSIPSVKFNGKLFIRDVSIQDQTYTLKYNVTTGEITRSTAGAGLTGTTSADNVFLGVGAGNEASTGSSNVFIGVDAGTINTGQTNVMIGTNAGSGSAATNGNIFIGYTSGTNESSSNILLIDNQTRGNQATSKNSAIIYGEFSSTAANQKLYTSGKFFVRNMTNASTAYGVFYDTASKELKYSTAPVGGDVTKAYVDASIEGLKTYVSNNYPTSQSVTDSLATKADYTYVNASLNVKANNASLGAYTTNASINANVLSILSYTNSSTYIDGSLNIKANNASLGLYATNVSLGLYTTNASINANATSILSYTNSSTYIDGSLNAKAPKLANFTVCTSHYLVSNTSDNLGIIDCSGTFTVTFPNTLSVGFQTTVINAGPGVITLSASTMLATDSSVRLRDRYAGAAVIHKGSGRFYMIGNLR